MCSGAQREEGLEGQAGRARRLQRHHQAGGPGGNGAIRAQIDAPLVDAYLARRALDYLVGFTLSPVLWRKLPGARSAGRVQSVALRLICDREAEIEPSSRRNTGPSIARWRRRAARLSSARLADFNGEQARSKARHRQRSRARRPSSAMLDGGDFTVGIVEASRPSAIPSPPFTTSTLQQEASPQARLLGHAHHAGGPEALRRHRHRRRDRRPHHLHANRRRADRRRKRSTRSARVIGKRIRRAIPAGQAALLYDQGQERPGSPRGDPPDRFRARRPKEVERCSTRPGALYDLIWKRTIASQMERPRSSARPSTSTPGAAARRRCCAPPARSCGSTAS